MKIPKRLHWTLAGLGLAWGALFGTYTSVFYEKLTLTLSTPTGPKSASAITTVRSTTAYGLVYNMLKGLTGGATGSSFAAGPALMLEVTPGRWLFVLRSSPSGSHSYDGLSSRPFSDKTRKPPDPRQPLETIEAFLRRSAPGTEIVLRPPAWPAFVTLDNPADPKTLRLVDPENLAASFGPGVSLQSLTLSAAKAPGDATPLMQLMPWLCTAQSFPTDAEREAWTDLDRRLFSLRDTANFLPTYCGP